ncbi:phosphoribosylformylglycinamidine synthase [Candidatus Kaiserbacteria bacterium]|nr:phosphoribosylformylglycinamidine synthase [Candidatus Kaiserbacteria bacterium]
MAHQIHVCYTAEDGRGASALSDIHALGKSGKGVENVTLTDTYTTEVKLSTVDLKKAADALHTPLSQTVAIDKPLGPTEFSYAVEVGFLPGVTDNVGATAKETIQDVLKRSFKDGEMVFFSRIYFLEGKITKQDVMHIAESLHNPLIQRVKIKSFAQYKKERGMGTTLPKVKLPAGKVSLVDLYVSDEELAVLGKKGVKNADGTHRGPLGLGIDELKAMRSYFHRKGRLPTDVEIEALAQTWSEHCKHTIFANPLDEITEGIYKRYIKQATKDVRKKKGKDDFCVSVFSDNSGVIKFDKDTYITHKVETHNSPSALDPFGGAITGIVGVNRDTIGTGLGAKPLLNIYGYCFADPADKTRLFRDKDKTEELLPAKRIMDGVIEGVNVGGNQSGIPTPQGFTYFEPRYRGKPLVFVGTIGVMPKTVKGKPSCEKQARSGDYIVMVGGRVGLDGIHGATFSSEALDSGSPATAVQIGDAITQKKFSDAIVKEARDQGLYSSITDNGAGGLSSSVGEMAEESGGCEVWLDKVPVKYPGLAPWEIWISESQERMSLAVPKSKWPAFKKLMEARGSEATVIGEFTDSGKCTVRYNDEVVLDLDMDFMHDGNPVHMLESKEVAPEVTAPTDATLRKHERKMNKTLLSMLARANVGSTEFISSQYDHEVQGVSVTKPLHGRGRVNATASVSRPHTDTKKGIVLSQGLCPSYSDLDTYHMAASAIDQAIRNAVAIGADPEHIALLDNFCWCSSDKPERLYELKRSAEACYDYAVAYEAPFISGKDSMFNDFKGFDTKGRPVKISVPPTLLISSIAVIEDVSKSVTLDFKHSGDLIYLLGDTNAELGAGEYMAYLSGEEKKEYTGEHVPEVDAKANRALFKKYHRAVEKELVASGVALDRGGLGMTLLKSAIGGQLGAAVNLKRMGGQLTNTERLFSESNGRILATVAPEHQAAFERTMKGSSAERIGVVADTKEVLIMNGKEGIAELSLSSLTRAYRSKFKNS